MRSGDNELSVSPRGIGVEGMALINHQDDCIDVEPAHYRTAKALYPAVGIVVVRRMACGVIGVHCVSLSDYRNRLDLKNEPDNDSGAKRSAHRRLLVNHWWNDRGPGRKLGPLGSALGERTDWIIRKRTSALATSAPRILPSEVGRGRFPILSEMSPNPSSRTIFALETYKFYRDKDGNPNGYGRVWRPQKR